MGTQEDIHSIEGNQGLLSITEVARRLDVHVKTARRFVQEGRLKAIRVGRQYRVTTQSLAQMTGQPVQDPEPVRRTRHVEASSIVQIDAISPEDAARLVNSVGGAIKGKDRRTDTPMRVDTVYDDTRGRLKIIVTGSLATTSALLQLVSLHLS